MKKIIVDNNDIRRMLVFIVKACNILLICFIKC